MGYLWTSIKLQFRIPISIFFSLLFPLIMMFAMVTSYGNFDIGGGYQFVDKYFLISTGMGMLPIALISFPIWLGESIQSKSYKRLEYFGISSQKIIFSDVCSYILLTVLSIFVNILFGYFVYGLHIPSVQYFSAYILQCLYCNLVLLIFGALLALIIKNTRILMPAGMCLLFMFYIFTGAFSAFSELPKSFQTIGDFLPMKYIMNDLFNVWTQKELFISQFLLLNTFYGIILAAILILLLLRQMVKSKS
ncbi:ABC transporter permease [Listeria seeligeri]|uniref:ABC transporter permease n=1 Tax=Listeria seeligeri TaxID=1640 RepID=UPI00111A1286|nr:ABC transporter permease [Listeria seeligeri]MBC1577268.1 ABC transporter permease [Listeria seeligeri]MBC1584945.1 ABC transporter permease [Listeria seeligeri]MBC1884102.1 ABC transporter permease [Listeria seeligeri]MBC2017537.1 ABC transporter permease [Listeria seeligeri]MBC2218021.1 ABC transporter permease [Listeria seeligeri]